MSKNGVNSQEHIARRMSNASGDQGDNCFNLQREFLKRTGSTFPPLNRHSRSLSLIRLRQDYCQFLLLLLLLF